MRLIYYLGLVNNKLATFCRNHSQCKDSKQPETQKEDIRRIPIASIPFFPILTFIYSNNATTCFKARIMFCTFSEQLVCKIVHMPVAF